MVFLTGECTQHGGPREDIVQFSAEALQQAVQHNMWSPGWREMEERRRIVMLSSEVDKGIESWNDKQEEAQRMEEHNKSLLLKPKGMMLIKNKSKSNS
ncbi:hypothetical protein F7725_004616 [Dissostichus mawsoni]|uniref:Uncharacterized protein n=1 Tax=Dissostichus mawsoni TaxID=36200 RepID=A0A7J5XJ80_DISMA|nr:hypothetical protein F7725_004616 [Dissostichus mawsoni]